MGSKKEPNPVHHHKPSAKQNIINLWNSFRAFVKEVCTPPPFVYVAPPLCERALFCIPKTSFIRRHAIIIAHWKAFEYATLLAIIANCATLAMDSNAPGFYESKLGRQLLLADYAFTGFFTLEALIKMLAQGIIFAPNTYMRNAWNFLDLIIVATGYISLAGFANVTALRAIRALRPLRAITRIKNMKLIVSTLLTSTTLLLDMLVLTAFFLAIFGTMCVQLFGGQLRGRCGFPDFSDAYTDEQGVVHGVQYHVPDAEKLSVCRHPKTEDTIWTNTTNQDTGAVQLIASGFETSFDARDCPFDHPDGMEFGMYCTPFGNPGASGYGDLSIGFWSFDNILLSWVVIFQHMTMGNWAFNMYFTQDGVNWWTWILHFAMTILGGMLLINLALAVIFMNYERIKAETTRALEAQRRQEELEEQAKVQFANVLHKTLSMKHPKLEKSSSKRFTKAPSLARGSSLRRPVMESTTPDVTPKLKDLARMPLSLKRPSKDALFSFNKISKSFSSNSWRGSPGASRARQEDSNCGVRQRMAGPADVETWAKRLRARANWRKAGMLTLPNHSPAFTQLCAVTEEAMEAAPQQLVQLSAWRYNTSGRVEVPKDDKPARDINKSAKHEEFSDLPAFPDLTDTSSDNGSEEGFKPEVPSDSEDSEAGMKSMHQSEGAADAVGFVKPKKPTNMSWWAYKAKRIKKWCYKASISPNFELSNALAICINAIVLGLNWYLMPKEMDFAMDLINYCFTVYFVVETNIRMIGLGPDLFFGTFMNSFGYVISFASLSEMIVALEPTGPEGAFNGALTTIRLLRLLKLARYWKGLKIVLRILSFAVRSGIYLLMLVLLFMFVMGLLGLQLFGHQAVFCKHIPGGFQTCPPGETDCPSHRDCFITCSAEQEGQWLEVEGSPYGGMALCERFPRDPSSSMDPVFLAQVGKPERLPHHFDDMFHAFITVFVIITLDNWTGIMFPLMSGVTPWVAIYFVFCVIIGAFMMLQLFLAILLSGLDELEKEIKAEQHSQSLSDILKASSVGVAGRELSRSVMNRFPGRKVPGQGGDEASMLPDGKKGPHAGNQFLLDYSESGPRKGRGRTRKTSVDTFADHLSRIHSTKPGSGGAKSSVFPRRAQGPEQQSGGGVHAKQGFLPPIFPGKTRVSANRVSPAPLPPPPPSTPPPPSPEEKALAAKAGDADVKGPGQTRQQTDPPHESIQRFDGGSLAPPSPFLEFDSQHAVHDKHSSFKDGEGAALALPYLQGLHGIKVGSKDELGGAKQVPQRNMSGAWTTSGKQAPLKPHARAAAPATGRGAAAPGSEGRKLGPAASGNMAEAAAAAAAATAAAAAATAAIARAEQSLHPSTPSADEQHGVHNPALGSIPSPGRGSVSSSVDAPSTPSMRARGSASMQSTSVGDTSESGHTLAAAAAAALAAAASQQPSENQQQQQQREHFLPEQRYAEDQHQDEHLLEDQQQQQQQQHALEPPAPQLMPPISDSTLPQSQPSPVPSRQSLDQHPHPHQQQQPGSEQSVGSPIPRPPSMILYPPTRFSTPPDFPRQDSLVRPLGSAEPLDPIDWPRELPGVTQATIATVSEFGPHSRAASPIQVSDERAVVKTSSTGSSQSSSAPSIGMHPAVASLAHSRKSSLLVVNKGGTPNEIDDHDHPFVKELQSANNEDSLEGGNKDAKHKGGHGTLQFAGVAVPTGDDEDDDRGLGLRALGLGGPHDRGSGQPTRVTPGGTTRPYSEMLARRKSSLRGLDQDVLKTLWDEDMLQGTACWCLGPNNWLRIAAARIIAHRSFEAFIIVLCVASSVLLALDDVTLDRNSTKALVLRNLDASFTAVFGLEIVLKVLAMGVLFNGKNSYLRSGWNQVDLFVVAISVIVLVVEATVTTDQVPWLRALRAVRCLRVLRVSMKVPGVKVVVKALKHLIPSLFNTLAVGLLFFYIFAILAVALLNGRMHYCADEADDQYIDPYYVLPQGHTIYKDWCEAHDIHQDTPRTITTSYYHSQLGVDVPPWNMTTSWTRDLRRFDNIFNGLWVLYQMASVEGWSAVMFKAQMATEQERQPIRDANKFIALFFMLFMFVSSFVVLNLIIGVSILKFHEMKDANDGQSPFLTPQQSQWLSVQHMLSTTQLETLPPPAENWFRRIFHLAIYNKFMDRALVGIILANTFVMFLAHYGMGPTWEAAIDMTNLIVTIIFAVEMCCKLIAIGIRPYFRSNWNCFDAFITALSVLGVLLENLSAETVSFLPVLRALRVARIFRLIPRAKGLRKLLRTLYWSIPAVTNVAYVLFLFLYLWAIVGMNLWGNIKLGDASGSGINRHANFRHFPISMITEFRMITGENWNNIMHAAMIREDCLLVSQDISVSVTAEDGGQEQVTLTEGQYLDPINDQRTIDALSGDALEDQCSLEPFLAVLYFCSFMLVCSYILLQLVIGIILDSIQSATLFDYLSIGPDDVQVFIQAWEVLDPQGTSYISVWQLSTLLSMVPPSLGAKGMLRQQMQIVDIIYSTDIPLRNLKVHFMEVLHALAGRVAGAELPAEEELRIHAKLVKAIPQETPKYLAAHAYAALAVCGAVRGFLHRRRLENEGTYSHGSVKTPRVSLNGSISGGALQRQALCMYPSMTLQDRLASNLEGPDATARQQRLKVIEETNKQLHGALQQQQQQQQQLLLQKPERPRRTFVGFAQGEGGSAEGGQPWEGPEAPLDHAQQQQQQQQHQEQQEQQQQQEQQEQEQQLEQQEQQQLEQQEQQQLEQQEQQQQGQQEQQQHHHHQQDDQLQPQLPQQEQQQEQQQHHHLHQNDQLQPQLPQQEQQHEQQQQQQQQPPLPQQEQQQQQEHQQQEQQQQHHTPQQQSLLPPLLPPLLVQLPQQQHHHHHGLGAPTSATPRWGGALKSQSARLPSGEVMSRPSSSQQSLGTAGPRSCSNPRKTSPARPPRRLAKLQSIPGPRSSVVKLPPVKPHRLQSQQPRQAQEQAQREQGQQQQQQQQQELQLRQQPGQ